MSGGQEFMRRFKKVEISGVNTYELPTIPWEQMRNLFQRLAGGEVEIREELIKGNLKPVLSVLKILLIAAKIWTIFSRSVVSV